MSYGILSPINVVRASASDNDARRRHTPGKLQTRNLNARPGLTTTHKKSTVKTEAYRYEPSVGGGGGFGSLFGGGNGGNGPRKKTDSSGNGDNDGRRRVAHGALMTASVLGCADGLSQVVIERRSSFDYIRTLRFAAFGLVIKGPLMTLFYRAMDGMFPGKAVQTVAKKIFMDQGPFSWIINSMFLFALPLMEGHSFNTAYQKAYDNIVPMQMASYKVWPAVHVVNYAFVPPAARIIFVNTAGFVWATFCCMFVGAPKI